MDELMDEEIIKNALSDSKMMNSLFKITTNQDFFVGDGVPKRKLADCLKSLSDDAIDIIYSNYQVVVMANNHLKDITDRKEQEEKLKKIIKECFRDFINTGANYADIKTLERLMLNQKLTGNIFDLLCDGFVYQYKKDNEYTFILPDELVTIYKEAKESGVLAKLVESEAKKYFSTYLLINGIVKKTVMKDVLVNHHGFNLTDQQIELLSEKELNTADYYSLAGEELVEQLSMIKDEEHYLKFNDSEINNYFNFIGIFMREIEEALGVKYKSRTMVFLVLLLSDEYEDGSLKEFGLPKKETKALESILEKYHDEIRYWCYDGRTGAEEEFVLIAEEAVMSKKPKKATLDNCLANTDKQLYDDEDLSKEDALKNLDEICNQFELAENLVKLNNKSIYELRESFDYFNKGLLFSYEDKDDIKCLVPDDVIEAIDNKENDMDEKYAKTLVAAYMGMNCVLRKEKLQELLKNHDFNYDIKRLDELVKESDCYILNDKYYSMYEEFEGDGLEEMLKDKDKFSKYKPADLLKYNNEFTFYEKLWDLVKSDISISTLNRDNYFNELRQFAKENDFTRSNIEGVLEYYNIDLSSKLRDKMMKLYNEYKDSISIWAYNGYTVSEYNNMKKESKKVGRNDSCPCGSGKKYKKCCGK